MKDIASIPVQQISVARIHASSLNPRSAAKTSKGELASAAFSDEKLDALAASMRSSTGQLEAVLVRPHPTIPGDYELANGERRWRAAQRPGSGLDALAAKVRELSDADMVEIALAIGTEDNVESLSPLEEAAGFESLMKLRTMSARQLAAHIGRAPTHVADRLALLKLPQNSALKLRAGELPTSTAILIANIPPSPAQAEAEAAILKSDLHGGGVMPLRAAKAFIRENVYRPMAGAPFDTKSATLLAKAGACVNCQFRAGNNPDAYGEVVDKDEGGGADKCMHPQCFVEKIAAHRLALLAKLAVDGKLGLTDDEQARAFLPKEKGLHYSSEFVAVNERPSPDLLKKEVNSAPTWRELIGEGAVQIYIGVHQDGHGVELVKRDEAIAAADLNERKIFNETQTRRGTVAKPSAARSDEAEASRAAIEKEEKAARAKAEKAQRKRDTAAAQLLREIADNMLPPNEDSAARLVLWTLLYDLAAERLTVEEIAFVVRAWDQDVEEGERNRTGLDRLGGEMGVRELQALVVMMTLAPRIRAEGAEGELANEWWSSLCAPKTDDVEGLAGEEQAQADRERSYEAPTDAARELAKPKAPKSKKAAKWTAIATEKGLVEGVLVEWVEGGPEKSGKIITVGEWEKDSGSAWEKGWSDSLPVRCETSKTGNFLRVVEIAALRLKEAA